jgi:hypothetical protein
MGDDDVTAVVSPPKRDRKLLAHAEAAARGI